MKVGYVRVSTVEQNTARQEVILEKLQVEKVFIDKMSGKNTERPALKEMLNFVREKDVVVVESFSRLARNTIDLLQIVDTLNHKGVFFQSQKEAIDTETPSGKFMLTVFAAMAQLERETILQRQREGIEIARKKGLYKGRVPIPCPDFEAVVKLWRGGEITAREAQRRLKISSSTFYRKLKKEENCI